MGYDHTDMSRQVACPCGARFEVAADHAGPTVPCPQCARVLRLKTPRAAPLVSAAPREQLGGSKRGMIALGIGAGALALVGVGFFLTFILSGKKALDEMPPSEEALGGRGRLSRTKEEVKWAGGAYDSLAKKPKRARSKIVQPRAPDPRQFLATIHLEHGTGAWDVRVYGDPEGAHAAIADVYPDPRTPAELSELLDLRHRIYLCMRAMADYLMSRRHEFNWRGYAKPGIDAAGHATLNEFIDGYQQVIREIEDKVVDRLKGVGDPTILDRALQEPIDAFTMKAAGALEAANADAVRKQVTKLAMAELDLEPIMPLNLERVAVLADECDPVELQKKLIERLDNVFAIGQPNPKVKAVLERGADRERLMAVCRAGPTGAGLGYLRELYRKAGGSLTAEDRKALAAEATAYEVQQILKTSPGK